MARGALYGTKEMPSVDQASGRMQAMVNTGVGRSVEQLSQKQWWGGGDYEGTEENSDRKAGLNSCSLLDRDCSRETRDSGVRQGISKFTRSRTFKKGRKHGWQLVAIKGELAAKGNFQSSRAQSRSRRNRIRELVETAARVCVTGTHAETAAWLNRFFAEHGFRDSDSEGHLECQRGGVLAQERICEYDKLDGPKYGNWKVERARGTQVIVCPMSAAGHGQGKVVVWSS
ncbi:hypothetical protein FB45DRAFT_874960 [Roridomyces roridus]|uniref:Uncharacterized protein n=1 Tax=Roridomyces roridus TaxID=1738132 RepID=A0AAD7B786_9AGAR|nr:hypothetical protein FB45DRAFT_874960 [Roridomyces roridus]